MATGLIPTIAAVALLGMASAAQTVPQVEITERVQLVAAGPIGSAATVFISGSPQGAVERVVLRGNRFARTYPSVTVIVDIAERQKYQVAKDVNQYTETTLDQEQHNNLAERRSWQATPDPDAGYSRLLDIDAADLPHESASRASRFEYTVVRETGDGALVAGQPTQTITVTVTAVEKGKVLADDGGWIATSTVHLARHLPALDQLADLQHEYYGLTYTGRDVGVTPWNMTLLERLYPEWASVAAKLADEIADLDGTVLTEFRTFDILRTAKEVKAAAAKQRAERSGLKNAAGVDLLGDAPPQRVSILRIQREVLSISDDITESDLTIPLGYKRVKRIGDGR